MPNLLESPSFRYWLLAVVVLFLKMLAIGLVQGAARFRNDAFTVPEDARTFGRRAEAAPADPEMVERGARCWRNDLENIPIFLFLGLGFVLSGGPPWWAGLYFTVFTVARIGHTFFYLRGLQPHRTLAYAAGLAVCFALAGQIVARLLTVPVQ